MILTDYLYKRINEIFNATDPRTDNWIVSRSIWLLVFVYGIYFYFTYVGGPKFMKDRKPYNLDKIVQLYNILQIVFNGYLFYNTIFVIRVWKYKLICEPLDFSNNPLSIRVVYIVWYYYLLKILDLLDTVFFILRKKQNQITHVHVLHHAGMIFVMWIAFRFVPNGHGIFLGVFNTFVHMIMYGYYLLASLKYSGIWWKKYVTCLQILQFVLLAVQHVFALSKKDCEFPKFWLIIIMPNIIYLTYLFIQFYYDEYIKNVSSKNEKKHLQ